MKFIVDVMPGKLAKRLRLMGLDVLWENILEGKPREKFYAVWFG